MRRNTPLFQKSARTNPLARLFLVLFLVCGALSASFFFLSDAQLSRLESGGKEIVPVGGPVDPIAAVKPDPKEDDGSDVPSGDGDSTSDDTPTGVTDVTLTGASVYVMLDPGHGGKDGGCYYSTLKESDLNLAVAILLRDELQSRGIGVLMTRDTDVMVGDSQKSGLYTRATMCNKSNAVCFVSIHANAYSNDTSVHGIDTYRNVTTNEKSEALANYVQTATIKATGTKDRGLKEDSELVVIRETKVPSCLIEIGFLTNPTEFENLSDDAYRKKLAKGIANGVIDFLLEEGHVKEVSTNN